MTDLRKASEQALAVMTAKPSSITAADWAHAIDALRAALAEPEPAKPAEIVEVIDDELEAMVLAAFKVPPTQGWHYPLAPNQLRHFAALVAAAEREACIKIIEAHQIPVGNSPAGEMARDWTHDALIEIRDEIRARGQG